MFTSTQRSLLASYDGELLLAALDALGTVGLIPGAGLQRMAYGAADMEGRRWIMGKCRRWEWRPVSP